MAFQIKRNFEMKKKDLTEFMQLLTCFFGTCIDVIGNLHVFKFHLRNR